MISLEKQTYMKTTPFSSKVYITQEMEYVHEGISHMHNSVYALDIHDTTWIMIKRSKPRGVTYMNQGTAQVVKHGEINWNTSFWFLNTTFTKESIKIMFWYRSTCEGVYTPNCLYHQKYWKDFWKARTKTCFSFLLQFHLHTPAKTIVHEYTWPIKRDQDLFKKICVPHRSSKDWSAT